ncbi:MAG TPA: hypothetical protein VF441_03535 [Acidimicrobiia bacterium]
MQRFARSRRFLLVLAAVTAIGSVAAGCAPGGYHLQAAGGSRSIVFWTDPGADVTLTFTLQVIVAKINEKTGSHHVYQTGAPGPNVPQSHVRRSGNLAADCRTPENSVAGCNVPVQATASNGKSVSVGGDIFVGQQQDLVMLLAHEVGHAAGLAHFDDVYKDSRGLAGGQTMCSGIFTAPCTNVADEWPYSNDVYFYAEGDMNGFKYLASTGVELGAFTSTGNFEVVSIDSGLVRVQGWALDPDGPASQADVHVYAFRGDGSTAAANNLGKATLDRPDIAAAFPGLGAAHGFDRYAFNVADLGPGSYNVCAYGIDAGLGTGNVSIGCKALNV